MKMYKKNLALLLFLNMKKFFFNIGVN
jgi:hypothetical protein